MSAGRIAGYAVPLYSPWKLAVAAINQKSTYCGVHVEKIIKNTVPDVLARQRFFSFSSVCAFRVVPSPGP